MSIPMAWKRRAEREPPPDDVPDFDGPSDGSNVIDLHKNPSSPADDPAEDPDEDARLRLAELAWLKTKVVAKACPPVIWLIMRKILPWSWYLFRDLMIGMARTAVVVYSWLHLAEERQAARKMESKDGKAKTLRDINKDTRFRLIAAGVVAAVLAIAHLVVIYGWEGSYARYLWIELIAAIAFLEWVGHQPRPETDEPIRRRGPLSHGTSTRTLRRDLEEGFAAKKITDVGVVGMGVNKYGWHGTFETEDKISEELIAHLERWVHAPAGSLLVRTDPRNSAAHPFKLLIDDPLAGSWTPPDADSPRDIRGLATLGKHLFGSPLRVNLRTHIGLIGKTRSGKSSGIWALIDWITSCSNAKIPWGIDLSMGPALPIWRRCIGKVAKEYGAAEALLDEAIAEAIRRNTILAARAEDDESDEDLDENWDPTPADPALYMVLDEFHLLADEKVLLDKTKTLIRIGGKACVFLIIGTPKASKEDLGSAVVRSMINLKILFACEVGDITLFLGGGMVDQGWTPNRFRPAAGGAPNDAGKAFIQDGDHQEAEPVRMSRLSANECRDRARRRSGASAPKDSAPSTAPVLPDSLRLLVDAFAEFDRPAIPTAWIMRYAAEHHEAYATDWTKAGATGLALALRSHGVTTGRNVPRDSAWKGSPKGYFRDDIERAAAAIST